DAYWNETGRNSFQFEGLATPSQTQTPSKPSKPSLPFLIRSGALTAATLSFEIAGRDHPIRANVESLTLQEGDNRQVELAMTGEINGEPMRYDGRLGPSDALLSGGTLEFAGAGAFGDISLSGEGVIDDLFHPNQPALTLRLQGPQIQSVERLLGLEPSKEGRFDVNIDAGHDQDRWEVVVDGSIGAMDLDWRGSTKGLQSLDELVVDVHMRGPNLQSLLRLFGVTALPPEPFEVLGVVRRNGVALRFEDVSAVIGETVFDLNGDIQDYTSLRDSRLRLDISGPDIGRFRDLAGLPGVAEGPFSLALELQPTAQGLGVVQGRVESNLGRIQLSGNIGDQPGYVGTEATVAVSGPDSGALLSALGVMGFPSEPFTLNSELAVEETGIHLRTATLEGLLATRIEANGDIAYDFFSPATELSLRVTGDDAAKTTAYSNAALPAWSGAFEASTRLRPTRAGLRFDAMEIRLAENALAADAFVPLDPELEGLDVTFDASGPDLGQLADSAVDFTLPASTWAVRGHLRRVSSRLLIEGLNARVAENTLEGAIDLPWPLAGLGAGDFQLQASGPDLSTVLPRLTDFDPPAAPFTLTVNGALADGRWTFEPSSLEVGESRLEVEGTFDGLPDFSATAIDVQASLPDLSQLGRWAEEDLPTVPVNLSLRMTGAVDDLLIKDLDAKVGQSRITGEFSYSRAGPVPAFGVRLASERIDLRPLFPEPESPPVPLTTVDETTPGPSPGQTASERLIPDLPLPLEQLARQDLDLDLDVAEFQTHKRIVSEVDIYARVRGGALYIDRYQTRGLAGRFSATGSLVPREDGQADLLLDLEAKDLAPIRESWQNADPATLPQVNATAQLRSIGDDVRGLIAELDGGMSFYATEGLLPGDGLSALNLGLTDIILSAASLQQEARRPTTLGCFAGRIVIENGVLRTEPIAALRTDRVLVLSSGTIDLNTERLDVGFEVIPSRLLGVNLAELANSLLRIGGTLASPTAAVDPTGTLVYGGAAAATGGLSILAKGLFDRLRRSTAPCDRLRNEVIAEAAQPISSPSER
ncbi:MAG: AsmA-like C-terminal region-containing protein, partial [Pseudomonadota bacterium]